MSDSRIPLTVTREGKSFGPYSVAQAEAYLKTGELSPADLAWSAGMKTWQPLASVIATLGTPEKTNESSAASPAAADSTNSAEATAPLAAPEAVTEESGAPTEESAGIPSGTDEETSAPIPALAKSIWTPFRLARIAMTIAGIGAVGVGLFVATLPKHVSVGGDPIIAPDAGYVWVNPKEPLSFKVKWDPDHPHPKFDHVLAGAKEGTWVPVAGFVFENPSRLGRVRWNQGFRPLGGHAFTTSEPGRWAADPGYSLLSLSSTTHPFAIWQPKFRHESEHMTAAEQEGYWYLDPGYAFAENSSVEYPRSVWKPGLPHSGQPNVYAGTSPGRWVAGAGYTWYDPDSHSDFRVVPMNPARTYQLWLDMNRVDQVIRQYRCESLDDAVADFSAAQYLYGQLNLRDADPQLWRHVQAVQSFLREASSSVGNCVAYAKAQDNDFTATGLVNGVICLFADEPSKCWEDSKLARGAGNLVEGAVATRVCETSLNDHRATLNGLVAKRAQVRTSLQVDYGFSFPAPSRPAPCTW